MYNINAKANSRGIRKGSWTDEEDHLLRKCIEAHGEGNWHRVPHRAGLNRCRKSCRLRWMNYLKPNIKRGQFNEDEVDLIIRLHKLLGNRWSLIAGRIPGRTANDVKNYWNTHLHKKLSPSPLPPKHPNTLTTHIYGKNSNSLNDNRKKQHIVSSITSKNITSTIPMHPQVIKPQPWTFPKTSSSSSSSSTMTDKPSPAPNKEATDTSRSRNPLEEKDGEEDENDNDANTKWWENLVEMYEKEENGPRDGLGYPEPMYMSGSNTWPISSNEMHRSSSNYVQEHDIWEDDDLWNFDANVWQ